MNDYGILGCVVLLLLVPAAACLNKYYVRTSRPAGGSDAETSNAACFHMTLTRNVARIMCEGLHPQAGPHPKAGRVARAVYLFKEARGHRRRPRRTG